MPTLPRWRWAVCGLLLLATMLNYMDRQVLSSTAVDVQAELRLSDTGYGGLEMAFSLSFAAGGLLFGWAADRLGSVRGLYALVVLAWSAAGVATAWVETFAGLLLCRAWLGLAEAGHWPCAIRTTQRILGPAERPLGNGLLQSGAALGAILTPLVLAGIDDPRDPGDWRRAFAWIGSAGVLWCAVWLPLMKAGPPSPLPDRAAPTPGPPPPAGTEPPAGAEGSPEATGLLLRMRDVLLDRRLWVLALLSGLINAHWQFLRAWLPKLLEESRGYDRQSTLFFTSLYYVAADLGSIGCGWLTRRLAHGTLGVERARLWTMFGCASLAALSGVAAFLPRGVAFQAALLLVGFGSLGIFPNYYSLTQEISTRHQGKVTGIMSLSSWLVVAPLQPLAGTVIEALGRGRGYALSLVVGGFLPLLGMAILKLFWPARRPT